MNIPIRRLAYIQPAMLAMSAAAKGPEFFPVKEMHPGYLRITVTTPRRGASRSR